MNNWREAIRKDERYKDFKILPYPMSFDVLFERDNIPVVQVHSVHMVLEDVILGFCGQFKWEGKKLTSLDGDSYNEQMTVLGFNWFDYDGEKCLDILVDNDW